MQARIVIIKSYNMIIAGALIIYGLVVTIWVSCNVHAPIMAT